MNKSKLDNCLVVNFCTGERTEKLSDLCFEKLGFTNREAITGRTGFHEKFIEFAELAVESHYEYFIRNDADRLVFSGILDVLDLVIEDDNISWATGTFYDYVMNRFRGGTPSVIRRDCLEYLVANKHLMKDVQKPEATFAISIEDRFKIIDVKTFTNLHEYEQYPSKVCNAFLNRLARNHYPRLYDNAYLNSLPDHYRRAITHAFEIFSQQGHKNSMKFQDFSFLDEGFLPIDDSGLEQLYSVYLKLYQGLVPQSLG